MDDTFYPQTLAADLSEVCRIYADFFSGLTQADWDRPVRGKHEEWTLHQTIAHLCALNGAGLEAIKHTMRGEPYTFSGLDSRYDLNAYNRMGIDNYLGLSRQALCTEALDILGEAASIADSLQPDQAGLGAVMPIYNRPISIVEALSIIMIHAGLFHSAQVAEPAGVSPLWTRLSPEIRHRTVGRVMRALSVLYRYDLTGSLKAVLAFRVDGAGGGSWHIDVSPTMSTSPEGAVDHANLVIHLRETAVFCRMFTGRLNPPVALLTGQMKLRGDLRLFLRMNTLFSVDARPLDTATARHQLIRTT